MTRLLLFCLLSSTLALAQPGPAPGQTTKPWTYWWWLGSAANEKDITGQLEQFAKAGLGGVHIIPIYGVKGAESAFIPFLSKRWLDVFAHTVREGKRLGLGVDLTTGTGWPFGGPGVSEAHAAKAWKLVDGKLTAVPTRQQVKRPAPGGAGPVIDYFSRSAIDAYLVRFDSTLNTLPQRPRAVYNDSYEVFGANWSDDFLAQFQKRRGYDLQSQLAAFLDTTGSDAGIRVHQDYHQTLSELLHDGFTRQWTDWARRQKYLTRHQAHGSPGNLIDLYTLADIPETESFGSSRFPIPGLRVDANYEVDRFGTPNPLAMKLASSAAHLAGKKLVSSETGTWLANHFQVSLSQLKPQIDELFASGINHVFYHGIPYSPPSEPWPGWLFYASTHYGPQSHFWPHLPQLNSYVERCQSRLQTSAPDHDLLVYFPIHDLWATRARSGGGIHQLEVHHVERWLLPQAVGQLGEQLLRRGFAYDFISDEWLNRLTVSPKGVRTPAGTTYRAIVIPRTTYFPESTLRQLAKLAQQGARIVFEGALPTTAPGFFAHAKRSGQVRELSSQLSKLPSVRVSNNVFNTLREQGVRAETWAEQGLSFLRKRRADGTVLYFVTNLGNTFRPGWITPATTGTVRRYNPLTDQTEPVAVRAGRTGQTELFLALEPGQSCFLEISPGQAATRQSAVQTNGMAVLELSTPWQFRFGAGRPTLSGSATLPKLVSWTSITDSAGYFWGTGHYQTTFDLPAGAAPNALYELDLGDVREVAEVQLNGQPLGTAWCLPFRLSIPANRLKTTGNTLEIAVTNLSANYMRLFDKQHPGNQPPGWKKFYDINIVDIRYRPFDATGWDAQPSGLLGPVKLLSKTAMADSK
ncbi:glycoside hydrolase [Rudanella paleaurantiibacter]|uniref:Glycoside hydrolase n=1 Tax=Rudanella paleaurantiibacter TaxID=2614655 RepID=A0A7J5U085_9BACT|nr:glycosyl hydrolase [Rudanella paleaurantiibacter]KAB7730020.1 glycoside hydrolase [Rudanella paleaurantiibacter]